jgi:hypothetical protein
MNWGKKLTNKKFVRKLIESTHSNKVPHLFNNMIFKIFSIKKYHNWIKLMEFEKILKNIIYLFF